ncbi:hypothetical protein COB11_06735 [Candidatus Aerophobetes bacterium]|uniref:Uncharacterized protein n=1 Tax=Aerophobetes bacterium TaxID=2030807 RepID=A0A2A4YD54_UNCAE|nr:MAG: hypothetical protein COB11_06735 [Candidatus Aerophobetes bacterium]
MTQVLGMNVRMPTVADVRWTAGKAVDITGKTLAGVAGIGSVVMLATAHLGKEAAQQLVTSLHDRVCELSGEDALSAATGALALLAISCAVYKSGQLLAGKVTGPVIKTKYA